MRQLKISKQITGRDSFSIEKYLQEIGKIDVLTPDEEVALAKKICRQGHCCVMSPAAASYGIFKNFEARGEAFAELVRKGV